MKKKGLIISTVVMVVVLIASLTTATYAWFTASSSVAIDTIQLNVKSSAKVKVGVKTDTTVQTKNPENYMFETVTPDGTDNIVRWTGGTVGLGQVLSFDGLNLGQDKAIGEGVATVFENVDGESKVKTNGSATNKTNLSTIDAGKKIIKAASTGEIGTDKKEPIDVKKVYVAEANKDYLDATIGAQPATSDLQGTYAKVVVKTTGTRLTLGMNAAVHFVITVGEKTFEIEPFGTGNSNNKQLSSFTSGKQTGGGYVEYNSAEKTLTSTFYFWIAKGAQTSSGETTTTASLNPDTITEFRIMAYIAGADIDCNSNVTDSGCTIDISFDGTQDINYLEKGKNDTVIKDSTTIVMYDYATA